MKELDEDLFNLHDEQPQPIPGSLLVAKPTVDDFVFGRSVIILVNHDEDGSMGIILNHPLPVMLSDVLNDVNIVHDAPLYVGGPVETDRLFYIHTLGNDVIPDSFPLSDGLYLGGDFDAMTHYLSEGGIVEGKIKFFLGYSGWSAGQLQKEVERDDWAVLDNHDIPTMMGEDMLDMWNWAVSQFGPCYRMWSMIPLNPYDN